MKCPGRLKCFATGICVFLNLMPNQCPFIPSHCLVCPMYVAEGHFKICHKYNWHMVGGMHWPVVVPFVENLQT